MNRFSWEAEAYPCCSYYVCVSRAAEFYNSATIQGTAFWDTAPFYAPQRPFESVGSDVNDYDLLLYTGHTRIFDQCNNLGNVWCL